MRDSVAAQRYLTRHIEPGLPQPPHTTEPWGHVLVVPAYSESPALLQHLESVRADHHSCLIVLVLNHPDSAANTAIGTTANDALRRAILQRYPQAANIPDANIYSMSKHTDLCLLDIDALRGPLPAAQGVGLARKIGCDLAFKWISAGAIQSRWIHCSDADATLPENYFAQTSQQPENTSAAVYPFVHRAGKQTATNHATALYELRILHYVLGLDYANSPYAYHTLGSCLAVNANAYAHCRGFARRSGAEDFYLLNKLAKLGTIARLQGDCIELASRISTRVPFGTGPAVQALSDAPNLAAARCFYHPEGFIILKQVLRSFSALAAEADTPFEALLESQGVTTERAKATQQALDNLGWEKVLNHCRRQSRDPAHFTRSLHEWFDGFRTLKFLHALQAAGLEPLTLEQLQTHEPSMWPPACANRQMSDTNPSIIEDLRSAIRNHWGWHA